MNKNKKRYKSRYKNKSKSRSKSKSRGKSKNKSKSRGKSRSRGKSKSRSRGKKYINNIIKYKPEDKVYKINMNGNIDKLENILISYHIPIIIKYLINKIPNKFNNEYILCPYYNDTKNFQIGVTETVKFKEDNESAIYRGANEELGIKLFKWHPNNIIRLNNKKNWYGVSIKNYFVFQPNLFFNKSNDNPNKKVALIIFDKLNDIIKKYKNIKEGDIITDNINGIGLITVNDCKKIIKKK